LKKKSKKEKFFNFSTTGLGDEIENDFKGFNLDNAFGSNFQKDHNNLFLGRFTKDDLMKIMKEVGLIAHLEKKGFEKFIISLELDDTKIHYLKLYYEKADPNNILLDLRLSEEKFIPDKKFFPENEYISGYDMIVIEWLSAQDPRHNFSPDKPQLPGQAKPGLGILNYCFEMMYVVAREVSKDGFMDVPDHLHLAMMYSKRFKFFDPVQEGVFQAITRDLKDFSLVDITWGMITDTIIEKYKNEPQEYKPTEQIYYVSERLRSYFHSSMYRNAFSKYLKRKSYEFHYDEMVKKREAILKTKKIVDL